MLFLAGLEIHRASQDVLLARAVDDADVGVVADHSVYTFHDVASAGNGDLECACSFAGVA